MTVDPSTAAHREFEIVDLPEGAIFRIDRNAKLNALTRAVLDGLEACLDDLESRRARLLIVTASGARAFCAGTDLAELQTLDAEAQIAKSARARALFVRLSRSRVTSVAAINGLAFGGGLELAMACTLRIAVAHAGFSLPEIRLGLLPAYAGTQFLPALVGRARALEIMLTGRRLGADEALSIGLVHRLVAADDTQPLLDQAIGFGREVVAWPEEAVDWIRRCVDASSDRVSHEGLAVEDAAVRAVFDSADAAEGVTAFLEKRPPRFGGR